MLGRLAALEAGEMLVVEGPNGCGKTSLLQAGAGPALPGLAKRDILLALCAPGPGTSRLRPFAEVQVFGLLLGGVLA